MLPQTTVHEVGRPEPSVAARLLQISALADALGSDAPSLGTEKSEGVCGGSAHLVRTRIPVWSLIAYVRQGVPDQVILQNFPSLRGSDLCSARLYALTHPDEIDREIAENAE